MARKTPHLYEPAKFPITDRILERTFSVPEYSDAARREVYEILVGYAESPGYRSDWYWRIPWQTEGDRLHKRISRFFFREYRIKVDGQNLERLCEIGARYRAYSFRFDVTDRFDWRNGDYGDQGSCFWGSHTPARVYHLPKLGAVSLRTYKPGTSEGNGRCWITPVPPYLTGDGADGMEFVVSNYYGACDATDRLRLVIESLLADTYGGEWRSIPIHGLSIENVYINNTTPYLFTRGREGHASAGDLQITTVDLLHSTAPIPAWSAAAYENWRDRP